MSDRTATVGDTAITIRTDVNWVLRTLRRVDMLLQQFFLNQRTTRNVVGGLLIAIPSFEEE